MTWSWRIGRIAGIDLRVHVTFPLLFLWVALAERGGGATPRAVAFALGVLAAVFAVVVLHELGHALAARRFGIATRDITLLPLGGIARLERMPREPWQELVIAIAGPAVNLVLALLLFLALRLAGEGGELATLLADGSRLDLAGAGAQLLAINVWLAVFNLLPAFPMDGGRVLRALLALRHHDYVRATETAARVGRAFALLFGLVGLFVLRSPILVLIAAFVWVAAAGEAGSVRTTAALAGVALRDVLITDLHVLAPEDPLARAVRHTIDGFQVDYPVTVAGRLVGLLRRADLVRGLHELGGDAPVASAMTRDVPAVPLDATVEAALERLREVPGRSLPVVDGGRLVGLLTWENVSEYLLLTGARPLPARA